VRRIGAGQLPVNWGSELRKMKKRFHTARRSLLWFFMFPAFAATAPAQTYVPVVSYGGNWTPAGNPYILPAGECQINGPLTIQPGVIVEVDPSITFFIIDSIQATGTPNERITFESTDASNYWIPMTVFGTSIFKYCDFRNASSAVSGGSSEMDFMNCTFSNCTTAGINFVNGGTSEQTIPIVVKNCVFNGTGSGCLVLLAGNSGCGENSTGSAEFVNNVFENLPGTAIGLTSTAGLYSTAQIINNVFINCTNGVSAQLPWDATVEDSIFVSNTVAIAVPGTLPGQLSQDVAYNDFFACASNFSGYPLGYGLVTTTNRNGTPCDFTNNIFTDPEFADYTSFTLQSNSPCVDAGTPDWAWTDMCFPPSLGTGLPDLGIYGGPDACNWLDDVPLLPVEITTSVTNDSLWLNWGALPRSTYQVLYATDLGGFGNWLPFTNGQLLAVAKPTSFEISPNPSTNGAFFRVQSLGRTPGN
jgi:hypothetical protein